MIRYIEGMMCSGKTTYSKNLEKDARIATEPTPPPLSETPSLEERQNAIFNSYVKEFDKYIDSEVIYVCDYSPWGVIPFERALARYADLNNDYKTCYILNELAYQHDKILNDKLNEWGNKCMMLKYCHTDLDTILSRLKTRNRAGDNEWDPVLVKLIYEEYFKYFDPVGYSD